MIRIGVAGWDYPDWKGIVYPTGIGRQFDKLAYISRFVDVVEINSTFYRPVAPGVATSWVERTRDKEDFLFTAKAHRSWTHDADFHPANVPPTLDGLQPLREAGKLGALLVQFPQSFHYGPAALHRLDRIVESLPSWPVVIEVRHSSWESEEAAAWFVERQVGWCLVDQPAVGRSTLQVVPRVTGKVAYLRLHGRNAADWFRPDAGRDNRYNYIYSLEELSGLAAPARRVADRADELFVVQNNHYKGKALVNALQLKKLLQQRPPEAPEELVMTYPELQADVTVRRRRLF